MTFDFWQIVDDNKTFFFPPPDDFFFEIKYQAFIRFQQWQMNDSKTHGHINNICISDMKLQIVNQFFEKTTWNKLKTHCSFKK